MYACCISAVVASRRICSTWYGSMLEDEDEGVLVSMSRGDAERILLSVFFSDMFVTALCSIWLVFFMYVLLRN